MLDKAAIKRLSGSALIGSRLGILSRLDRD